MEEIMTIQTSSQSENKTYTQDQLREIVYVPSKETLPQVKEEIYTLGHEDLHDALLWIQDILERCSIPFIVGGELAKQMLKESDPSLSGDRVELYVYDRYLTDSTSSFLKTFLNLKEVDSVIETKYKDVPITIKILDKTYPFFDNPDTRFYYVTEFRFPNPFSEYWKEKDNI
jgi:hypothetical protein